MRTPSVVPVPKTKVSFGKVLSVGGDDLRFSRWNRGGKSRREGSEQGGDDGEERDDLDHDGRISDGRGVENGRRGLEERMRVGGVGRLRDGRDGRNRRKRVCEGG